MGEPESMEAVLHKARGAKITVEPEPTGKYSSSGCLLYTSDAADERSSVDLGGRRIIKKKKDEEITSSHVVK